MASFVWALLAEPSYNRRSSTIRLAGEEPEPEVTNYSISFRRTPIPSPSRRPPRPSAARPGSWTEFQGRHKECGAQYDETLRRLEESGDWLPEGLEYHVAFRSNGNFRVSEIWDSSEQFDAFGERLMPVLKDVGIELSDKPEMLEIHNIVKR